MSPEKILDVSINDINIRHKYCFNYENCLGDGSTAKVFKGKSIKNG